MSDTKEATGCAQPTVLVVESRIRASLEVQRLIAVLEGQGVCVVVGEPPAMPELSISKLSVSFPEPLEAFPHNPEQNYLKLRKRWS